MDVQYQCNVNDYVEAQNAVLKASVGYYILFIGGGFSLVLGMIVAYWGRLATATPALALALFWLAYPIFYLPAKIRRDFKKHPNFSRPCNLHVDDDGLRSSSDISTSETKWGAFVKFRETPNVFMVYFGGNIFRVIPKRAFAASQLEEFRELLRRKLPAK
jgi:hypothetical protein